MGHFVIISGELDIWRTELPFLEFVVVTIGPHYMHQILPVCHSHLSEFVLTFLYCRLCISLIGACQMVCKNSVCNRLGIRELLCRLNYNH
jgi:hypothetical protein